MLMSTNTLENHCYGNLTKSPTTFSIYTSNTTTPAAMADIHPIYYQSYYSSYSEDDDHKNDFKEDFGKLISRFLGSSNIPQEMKDEFIHANLSLKSFRDYVKTHFPDYASKILLWEKLHLGDQED